MQAASQTGGGGAIVATRAGQPPLPRSDRIRLRPRVNTARSRPAHQLRSSLLLLRVGSHPVRLASSAGNRAVSHGLLTCLVASPSGRLPLAQDGSCLIPTHPRPRRLADGPSGVVLGRLRPRCAPASRPSDPASRSSHSGAPPRPACSSGRPARRLARAWPRLRPPLRVASLVLSRVVAAHLPGPAPRDRVAPPRPAPASTRPLASASSAGSASRAAAR